MTLFELHAFVCTIMPPPYCSIFNPACGCDTPIKRKGERPRSRRNTYIAPHVPTAAAEALYVTG